MQGVFPNEYWASVVKDESTGDAMVGLERDLFIRVACAGVPSGEDPERTNVTRRLRAAMPILCASRRVGVVLNISSKTLATFEGSLVPSRGVWATVEISALARRGGVWWSRRRRGVHVVAAPPHGV